MAQVAQFKVAHLYPPYQGKGKASIVAGDGTKYKCEESQLAQFREGEDVAINYTDESFVSKQTGQPVTFKKFVSKIAKTNGEGGQKAYTRPSVSKGDAEQIFVNGKLTAYISAGMVPLDTSSIVAAVNKIRAAWHQTFGGSLAQSDEGLDDNIPF